MSSLGLIGIGLVLVNLMFIAWCEVSAARDRKRGR